METRELLTTADEWLGHLLQPPWSYLLVAALVLVILLYFMVHYRRVHRGIRPFKSQGGEIEIAPQTLRGVIQNAANSVEGVEKATCRHFLKGRKLGVSVSLHLRANNRLREVDSLVKRRIRATLLDQFGMENVEPVNIRVTRIVGDPMATVIEEDPEGQPETQRLTEDPPEDDERPYAEDTRL